MTWFANWLGGPGKFFISGLIVAFVAFNQVYRVVDPALLNGILAALASLGLWTPAVQNNTKK